MKIYNSFKIETRENKEIFFNIFYGQVTKELKFKKHFFFLQITARCKNSLELFLLFECFLKDGLKTKKNQLNINNFAISLKSSLIDNLENSAVKHINYEKLVYMQKKIIVYLKINLTN